MRMPGRFEWKILGAMLLVAGLCVGTATFALNHILRGLITVWEEERAATAASGKAADVFRAYFADRKDEFRRRTEALARSRPTRMADLASVDGLLRARLLEGPDVLDEWAAPPEALARARPAPSTPAIVPPAENDGAGPERILDLTFGIPNEMYEKYLALQIALERERDFEGVREAIVAPYVGQYLVFVASVLALVPMLGLFVARRATRRVARLREAAQRVGEGDLTVRVAPTGHDELDDLGRAFDRMVAELAEARSRLVYLQKVSAWQEVARRLAHEIKNPLTPIQLAVQELASKYEGEDPRYRRLLDTAVEILKEEITVLRRLVDDFSAFAKLPKVAPEPLDLAALIAEFPRLHPEWQPFLEVTSTEGPVPAACDRTLFGRVLANLVENAVQAAQGAGRSPRVRLAVEARRGRAAIAIEDNGPGVPETERHRIFDPYVTSKPQGTGLGLAIVRKIVIDHGGDVTVTAAPPPLGGARFVVEIPGGSG